MNIHTNTNYYLVHNGEQTLNPTHQYHTHTSINKDTHKHTMNYSEWRKQVSIHTGGGRVCEPLREGTNGVTALPPECFSKNSFTRGEGGGREHSGYLSFRARLWTPSGKERACLFETFLRSSYNAKCFFLFKEGHFSSRWHSVFMGVNMNNRNPGRDQRASFTQVSLWLMQW